MTKLEVAAHEFAFKNHSWLKDALPTIAAVESFAVVESFATVELLEELLLAALPDSVPMLEESAMSISEELPGVVMSAELESLSLQAKKVANVVAMNVVYTSLFRFIEFLL